MKPESPFFSIIIPVYNGSRTIKKCLDSIICQSFKDTEIIILDSLSDDGTPQIINDYLKRFALITYIREKDKGIYDAMNKGVAKAKGMYLYFLGSDDALFSDTVLETVSNKIKSAGIPDILYGNVLLGNSNLVHNGKYDLCKLYDNNICHQSIFYRKSIFKSNLIFDLKYPALADWYFNFQCFTNKSLKIEYANIVICQYSTEGFSSMTDDPLHEKKKELFLSNAKNFYADQYYKLKKHSTDSRSVAGKIKIAYFYLLYCVFHLRRKLSEVDEDKM